MVYRVAPKIFKEFPHFCRGVVVASDVDNGASDDAILEELFTGRIKEIAADDCICVEHPRIKAWREIYNTFPGKDARKSQPSIEALHGRIKKGAQIAFVSPLVCISNLISLAYLVPSGLIDAEKVQGNFWVTRREQKVFTP